VSTATQKELVTHDTDVKPTLSTDTGDPETVAKPLASTVTHVVAVGHDTSVGMPRIVSTVVGALHDVVIAAVSARCETLRDDFTEPTPLTVKVNVYFTVFDVGFDGTLTVSPKCGVQVVADPIPTIAGETVNEHVFALVVVAPNTNTPPNGETVGVLTVNTEIFGAWETRTVAADATTPASATIATTPSSVLATRLGSFALCTEITIPTSPLRSRRGWPPPCQSSEMYKD